VSRKNKTPKSGTLDPKGCILKPEPTPSKLNPDFSAQTPELSTLEK
jgi:hypothetical protein